MNAGENISRRDQTGLIRETAIGHVRLGDGTEMAALGQGTWRIGDSPRRRQEEIAALDEAFPPPDRKVPLDII
ncbi:hypothetical protein HMSSN036_11120 [Paenibacillus macerans]|uniref:hypothetical protein n=1 Tax=Paenibacillus sp. FSL R5-0527 TaxID=2975321 RepID=UPI00097A7FC7|nr:hypothetical protein BK140_28460 [Paenibacillus macerans]GJM68896.1 hypothetical protein HMSSN036_11120 [Paenibacillus macerans]